MGPALFSHNLILVSIELVLREPKVVWGHIEGLAFLSWNSDQRVATCKASHVHGHVSLGHSSLGSVIRAGLLFL